MILAFISPPKKISVSSLYDSRSAKAATNASSKPAVGKYTPIWHDVTTPGILTTKGSIEGEMEFSTVTN